MNKYTKFELIERILTGLITDGSYWLIDNVLCKWDDEGKRFLLIMHPNKINGFEFNDLNGGLTQSIGRIPDVAEEDYPPEWLNLDALTLFPIDDAADSDSQKGLITFK